MKYRIVKRADNKYLVQKKVNFFERWESINTEPADYPQDLLEKFEDDYQCSVFSSLLLAKAKLTRLVNERKNKKKLEILEVVEEISV